jgi:Hexokinase
MNLVLPILANNSVDATPANHRVTHRDLSSVLDVVHLGLTFSFPVEQTALSSGQILTWTKGFSAKHAVFYSFLQFINIPIHYWIGWKRCGPATARCVRQETYARQMYRLG